MTQAKKMFVETHIDNLENKLTKFKSDEITSDSVFDAIREAYNIFIDSLPQLEERVLWNKNSTETDARTVIGILRKYLIDNPVAFCEAIATDDMNFNKFWVSFVAWYHNDLPDSSMLKESYVDEDYQNVAAKYGNGYDTISFRYVNIDFDYIYREKYGESWSDIFEEGIASITTFKPFIEIIYNMCVDDTEKPRFVADINKRLERFKLPYKLKNGKFVSTVYESSITRQSLLLSERFDSDYINLQIKVMNDSIDTNPADAIGKAKELFENCCITVLGELKVNVNKDWTVIQLTKETCKVLKLTPSHINDSAKASDTIKQLLGNLSVISQSMAELRNSYGSGHGKDAKFKGLSPRHARLAVGSAVAAVLFIWETYKEQSEVNKNG